MALLSAAKVIMRRDPSIPLTVDLNAYAGKLLTEYVVKGSADLSSMPEEEFSREPLGRPLSTVTQRHLDRVKVFKQETLGAEGSGPSQSL
ncbi:hypothetical protein BGZ72_008647, partial [Mortierella alpina]